MENVFEIELSDGNVIKIDTVLIKGINDVEGVVDCCLISNGTQIQDNISYFYKGERKNSPFELTDIDIEIFKNNEISLDNNETIVEENN